MSNIINLASTVLTEEADAILALKDQLDTSFEEACTAISSCTGRVICMGMGKSGHIATKIAATFASTGTAAFFVHPGEAAHGDLGMIKSNDIIIFLSHSGESTEICQIQPAISHLNVKVIAITGNPMSSIGSKADICLHVQVSKEACPLGLAPTTSTTATLALGDALAVCVLDLKGFSREDFARSHPAGLLGRRLILHVDDVMQTGRNLPSVLLGSNVRAAIIEMTKKQLGTVIITNKQKKLCGILTDGDIRRMVESQSDLEAEKVEQFMTKDPVTVMPGQLAIEALKTMEIKGVNCCVVTDDNHNVIGLITMREIKTSGII